MAYAAFARVDPKSLATYVAPSSFSMAIGALSGALKQGIDAHNKFQMAKNKKNLGSAENSSLIDYHNTQKKTYQDRTAASRRIGVQNQDTNENQPGVTPPETEGVDFESYVNEDGETVSSLEFYNKPLKTDEKYHNEDGSFNNKLFRSDRKEWREDKRFLRKVRRNPEEAILAETEEGVEGIADVIKFGLQPKSWQKALLDRYSSAVANQPAITKVFLSDKRPYIDPNSPVARFDNLVSSGSKIYTVPKKDGTVTYKVFDPEANDGEGEWVSLDASEFKPEPQRNQYNSDKEYQQARAQWQATGGGLYGSNDVQKTGGEILQMAQTIMKDLPGGGTADGNLAIAVEQLMQNPNFEKQIKGHIAINDNVSFEEVDKDGNGVLSSAEATAYLTGVKKGYDDGVIEIDTETVASDTVNFIAGLSEIEDEDELTAALEAFPVDWEYTDVDWDAENQVLTYRGVKGTEVGLERGAGYDPRDEIIRLDFKKEPKVAFQRLGFSHAAGLELKIDREGFSGTLEEIEQGRVYEQNRETYGDGYAFRDLEGNTYDIEPLLGPKENAGDLLNAFQNTPLSDLELIGQETQEFGKGGWLVMSFKKDANVPQYVKDYPEAFQYYKKQLEAGISNPVLPQGLFSSDPEVRRTTAEGLPAPESSTRQINTGGLNQGYIDVIQGLELTKDVKRQIGVSLINNPGDITAAVNAVPGLDDAQRTSIIESLSGVQVEQPEDRSNLGPVGQSTFEPAEYGPQAQPVDGYSFYMKDDVNTENANPVVINAIEGLAKKFPITVTSLSRDIEKNQAVDGVENSRHLTGDAGDIRVSNLSPEQRSEVKDILSKNFKVKDEGDHIHFSVKKDQVVSSDGTRPKSFYKDVLQPWLTGSDSDTQKAGFFSDIGTAFNNIGAVTDIVSNTFFRNKEATINTSSKSKDDIKAAQREMARLGYNVGAIDGIVGPKFRAAQAAYNQDKEDGKADERENNRLRSEALYLNKFYYLKDEDKQIAKVKEVKEMKNIPEAYQYETYVTNVKKMRPGATRRASMMKIDALNMTMGLPQEFNTLEESPYNPQDEGIWGNVKRAFGAGTKYYRVSSSVKGFSPQTFINQHKKFLESGERKGDAKTWTSSDLKNNSIYGDLGNYNIGSGQDDKGHYISIYDKNDYKGGVLFGANEPFEIYDRIYYNPKTYKVIK